MKKFLKVFNIFISLALLATTILIGLLAFPVFGNQALIVRSGSMQPTIDVGSVIVVRPDAYIYKVGDIIAFRSENNSKTIISHRVTGIEKDESGIYYTTKGDANKTVDGWQVRPKNVLGKSFLIIPYVGKVLVFARSDIGLPLLIILPAAVVILFELFSIVREIRKKKNNSSDDSEETSHAKSFLSSTRITFTVLCAGIVLVLVGIVGTTFAFNSDTETSQTNVFQAAASFGTPTPPPTPTVPPIATTLVVNEFLWNTTCGNNANAQAGNYWIELYNGSAVTVDLKDWQFKDANNNIIQISNAVKLVDPGEYIVLTKDGSVFNGCFTLQGTPEAANLGGNSDFLPATTGGIIKLEQPNGSGGFIVIDRVEFGPTLNSGTLNTPPNQSIARNPNGVDTALGDTFSVSDFIIDSTISPGLGN